MNKQGTAGIAEDAEFWRNTVEHTEAGPLYSSAGSMMLSLSALFSVPSVILVFMLNISGAIIEYLSLLLSNLP
ncbi:MAG: hypothetical protein JWO03_1799 [Bacteroidetes bacterium]|nr:hypothetical protein [Bacteroidota bacterium]